MPFGITRQLSCPHIAQQNSIAERKHRHIVEIGLTFLAQGHLPLKFWNEAFFAAIFLINHLHTLILSQKSPLEILLCTKPDYSFIKTFGYLCFSYMKTYNAHKLDFKSTPYTFVSYSPLHKGYKLLTSTKKIIIFKYVVFNENTFPFENNAYITSFPSTQLSSQSFFPLGVITSSHFSIVESSIQVLSSPPSSSS